MGGKREAGETKSPSKGTEWGSELGSDPKASASDNFFKLFSEKKSVPKPLLFPVGQQLKKKKKKKERKKERKKEMKEMKERKRKKEKERKKERKKEKNMPAWRCWFNPWSGRSPVEGNGNTPLQFSCLGNLTDGGAWWATVHGVAKVRHDLRLNNKSYHSVTLLQRTRRKVSKQPSPFAILKTDQILSSPYPYKTTTGCGRKGKGRITA